MEERLHISDVVVPLAGEVQADVPTNFPRESIQSASEHGAFEIASYDNHPPFGRVKKGHALSAVEVLQLNVLLDAPSVPSLAIATLSANLSHFFGYLRRQRQVAECLPVRLAHWGCRRRGRVDCRI
jgi:hypothetical protein